MKVLFEVGDKVDAISHPNEAELQMDQPLRGWMKVTSPGTKDCWYRLDRVIAVIGE